VKSTLIKLTLLCVIAFGSFGCVAQRELDQQRALYRKSQEQVAELQSLLEEARSRIKALQEALKEPNPDILDKLQKAIAERDALRKALEEAEGKLEAAGKIGPVLPVELDQALKDLAASDPGLMEYDPTLGMVRFKSDLTFPPGSTEVSAEAQRGLQKLAEILSRPVAQKYEARIVGHTDNVRIGRASTRAQHPTNWHLSVHRAIAVKDVLEKAGVPPVRMEVAGYGEYRPIVPNVGNKGAEKNRRVEIFLVPNTYTGPGGEAAPTEKPAAREEAPAPEKKSDDDTAPEMFK
jgi:chemotaxis protein MotB